MENNIIVKEFYEKLYNEDDRGNRQPLEFLRTKIIISRYLEKPGMQIADIAGET